MATKKEDTTEEETEGTEDDDANAIDPVAVITQTVHDAMDSWWKKNRPAPNRTSQPQENTLMNTLFGKGYRK